MAEEPFTFYEFFAGGGMARIGLGRQWRCLFANDCCEKKARSYRANFGGAPELVVHDIRTLSASDLPGESSLAWASFPCQDLSLAGNGVGLSGERSGTFWSFWRLMADLRWARRLPSVVVLENVVGAISSNQGRDLQAIVGAMTSSGYRVGAMVVDAVHFVPQSRARLFIIAVDSMLSISDQLLSNVPNSLWHPLALKNAHAALPPSLRDSWVWWHLPIPTVPRPTLSEIIEREPVGVVWHSNRETARLLQMMSVPNRKKVEKASCLRREIIGTIYRRTRPDEKGRRVQRAEVRFDQVSGCLRTPAGGSSRQTILVVNGKSVRSRLLSPREAARLMGVPDTYKLPANYNDAYHLMGDGVVVPVVSWLEAHLLRPLFEPKKLASEGTWHGWSPDHSLRTSSAD